MTNEDPLADMFRKRSLRERWGGEWRYWWLVRPSAGVLVAPLLYVPAAISGNRTWLAVVAGAWVIGQVTGGLLLLVGDDVDYDEGPKGAAFWQTAAGQVIGLAPWLALALAWPSLTATNLLLLMPALAIFWMIVALVTTGKGATLGARVRTSPQRIQAMVLAGLFGFVAFIVGLVLLIKALRPLA